MTTETLKTAADLLQMPDDGHRYELVRGEMIRLTPAGAEHGVIAQLLAEKLSYHVRARRLGLVCAAETGYLLFRDPDTVRAPDVSFVSRERMAGVGIPQGYWPCAPDLAVEVVSPGDRFQDLVEKVRDYLAAGTRRVWVVEPRSRTVSVYRSPTEVRVLTAADELDGEDAVPGFRLPVADLFPIPPSDRA